ncbi:MAG TPA: FUSC family protein [Bryobacteraceae bacterium]|nr:FUSC family protein [Bryobacteraceae bacterium]
MPSAAAVPRASLWRAVTRFEAGKVRPWMGLRHTIGIVLPVVAGAMAGNTAAGMIAGLGALNVAVGDGTDPYAFRARRMLIASLCCSLAVVVGGLSGGTWVLPPMLAAGAFAAGMMVSLGTAEADIGTITLVTLIVFLAKPLHSEQALTSGLLALGGGLFQTALVLAAWPLRRYGPESRALSALYRELARAAAADSPIAEAPPASRESTEAQQALAGLEARDSVDAERYLALLSQAERIRLSLLALARLRTRIAREPETEPVTAVLGRFAALASQALRYVGESLGRPEAYNPLAELAPQMAGFSRDLRRAHDAFAQPVAAMIADARSQMDALAGQLRTVLSLAHQTTGRGRAEFQRFESARPWKLQFAGTFSTLAANLRLESPAFRHALRLAVCVGIGEFVARQSGWGRPYWVPMTIALVLKPDFTTTFSRGLQRVLGTLLGLVAATALVHWFHPAPALEIVFLAFFAFVMRTFGPANYGILAGAVSALVVFLFAVIGVSPSEVVVARALDTLAGGAIALLAYRLWPTWERTQAPEALAAMLDAYRVYFRAVSDAYLRAEDSSGAALDQARLAARIARSRLEASVARLRAEPGSEDERVAQFDRVLADSHRFIHAAMSLEAGLATSHPVPSRGPFRKFSSDAEKTLYYLAAALRDSRGHPGGPSVAAPLPDLREDHQALVEAGDASVPRYALVNVETDRIVNSLNTLTSEILPLAESPAGAAG